MKYNSWFLPFTKKKQQLGSVFVNQLEDFQKFRMTILRWIVELEIKDTAERITSASYLD